MDKEELFKELKEKYKDYLYGKSSFSPVYNVEKELQSLPTQEESEIKEILAKKERDEMKNEYCRSHRIPLIRIPYTQYENLCLEDILLDTTKFRIT